MSDASRITDYRSRITPEGNIYPENPIKCNIFKAHVFIFSWKLDDGFAYHIA